MRDNDSQQKRIGIKFDKRVSCEYGNRMRNLKSLIVAAAAVPGMASAEIPPAPTNAFNAVAVNSHKAYVKQETLQAMPVGLLPALVDLAGKDIVFVEPRLFSGADKKDFMALPAIPVMVPDMIRIPVLKTDTPANRNFKAAMNKDFEKSDQQVRELFFKNLLFGMQQYKEGKNYGASRYDDKGKSVCLIRGDLNASFEIFAKNMGSVPDPLVTPEFRHTIPDSASLMAFVLLHEAAHCNQNNQGIPFSGGVEKTLFQEIDADRQAIGKYNALATAGMALDPALPDKVKALRSLQPLLYTDEAEFGIIRQLLNDHTTGPGLGSGGIDIKNIKQEALQVPMQVKMIVYLSLPEELRLRYRDEIQERHKQNITGIVDALTKNLETMEGVSAEWVSGYREKMIHLLEGGSLKIAIADLAQKENPDLTYYALQALSERGASSSPGDDVEKSKSRASLLLNYFSFLKLRMDTEGYQENSFFSGSKAPFDGTDFLADIREANISPEPR